jgi:hypothetical protein
VRNKKHTSVVTTGSPEIPGLPCAREFLLAKYLAKSTDLGVCIHRCVPIRCSLYGPEKSRSCAILSLAVIHYPIGFDAPAAFTGAAPAYHVSLLTSRRRQQARRSTRCVIIDLQRLPPKFLAADIHLEGGTMGIEDDTEVSVFVRHRSSGRLVFNPKAIEALGLSPTQLAVRGYPLDSNDPDPVAPTETAGSRSA